MVCHQYLLWEKISPMHDHLATDKRELALIVKDEALLMKQKIPTTRHVAHLLKAVTLHQHAWLHSTTQGARNESSYWKLCIQWRNPDGWYPEKPMKIMLHCVLYSTNSGHYIQLQKQRPWPLPTLGLFILMRNIVSPRSLTTLSMQGHRAALNVPDSREPPPQKTPPLLFHDHLCCSNYIMPASKPSSKWSCHS